MSATLCAVLALGLLGAATDDVEPIGSYLCQPAYVLDDAYRLPVEPYLPQPGDIMLTTDKKYFFAITFRMAFSGRPHHSGIVVARPDGRMGLMEAGPFNSESVEIQDVLPTLEKYAQHEKVWIRRRCVPVMICSPPSARPAMPMTAAGAPRSVPEISRVRLCCALPWPR